MHFQIWYRNSKAPQKITLRSSRSKPKNEPFYSSIPNTESAWSAFKSNLKIPNGHNVLTCLTYQLRTVTKSDKDQWHLIYFHEYHYQIKKHMMLWIISKYTSHNWWTKSLMADFGFNSKQLYVHNFDLKLKYCLLMLTELSYIRQIIIIQYLAWGDIKNLILFISFSALDLFIQLSLPMSKFVFVTSRPVTMISSMYHYRKLIV